MKLMQVWIVCFALFFGIAELYQWIQGITLPIPVFAVAGTLLAVASNTRTLLHKRNSLQPSQSPPQPDLPEPAASTWTDPEAPPLPPVYYPGTQLPDHAPQPPRSISFIVQSPKTINKSP